MGHCIVVKVRDLPAFFIVALLTILAVRAFMGVVPRMTAEAGNWGLGDARRLLVASLASRSFMLSI